MDEERRQAIAERLEQEWRNTLGMTDMLEANDVEEIRQLPHLVEVMPSRTIECELVQEGAVWRAAISPVSPLDTNTAGRLIAGRLPGTAQPNEAILTEFAAYQLGFHTRSEAESLVGRKVVARVRRQDRPSQILSFLLHQSSEEPVSIEQEADLSSAVQRVLEAIDPALLTEEQRRLVELAFPSLRQDDSAETPSVDDPSTSSNSGSTDPRAEVASADQDEHFVEIELTICGIVSLPGEADQVWNILSFFNNQSPDIGMHQDSLNQLADRVAPDMPVFDYTLRVDSVEHLGEVSDELAERKFNAFSARWIIDDIQHQIGIARWVVLGIAGLVLIITAISISNMLVISVLQRIPEFGIMKSLGASGGQIMGMMLVEGSLLGAAGAVLAIVASWPIAWLVESQVRGYVSGRIGRPFEGTVFEGSVGDVLLVLVIATLVGAVASLLPALRAARLDPIEALRSN